MGVGDGGGGECGGNWGGTVVVMGLAVVVVWVVVVMKVKVVTKLVLHSDEISSLITTGAWKGVAWIPITTINPTTDTTTLITTIPPPQNVKHLCTKMLSKKRSRRKKEREQNIHWKQDIKENT